MRKLLNIFLATALLIISGCTPSKPSINEPVPASTSESKYTLDQLTRIENVETLFGPADKMYINTSVLSGSEIDEANAMFDTVYKVVLDQIDETEKYYKEEGYDFTPATGSYAIRSYASLNGNILSILLQCQMWFSTYTPELFYEGINIDINTGKWMSTEDVIKASDYTLEEVEQSLYFYGELHTSFESDAYYYSMAASEKSLPYMFAGNVTYIDESNNSALQYFRDRKNVPYTGQYSSRRLPLVYLQDPSHLYIPSQLMTMAGSGVYYALIAAGHTHSDWAYNNPYDPWGNPFGNRRRAMSDLAAIEAVKADMGIDSNPGEYYSACGYMESEYTCVDVDQMYMEYIENTDGSWDPYWVFFVYSTDPDNDIDYNRSPVALRAVDAFTGDIQRFDFVSMSWQPVMNGSPAFDVVSQGKLLQAIGCVETTPNAYREWYANPAETINIDQHSDLTKVNYDNITGLLVTSMEDNTVVRIVSVEGKEGNYKVTKPLYTLSLMTGQSAMMYVERPEGEVVQAIEFIAANGKEYLYPIYSFHPQTDIEYVKD